MAIAAKVTSKNHLPGFGDDRFVVYSKQFNALVDAVLELEGSDGVLTGTSLTLAGSALGTDALILTAGDILLTSGNLDITTGDVTIADGAVLVTDADNATSFSVTNATITTADTVTITTAAQTSGNALLITGGGANLASGGSVARFDMGAATLGSALELATSGTYTGTDGIFNLTAAGLTSGRAFSITTDAITSGDMLYLDNGGATMTGDGTFINCNDDDVSVFAVGANGATTIAGSAAGTAALTLSLGDLVLSDGGISVAAQSVTPNNDGSAASIIDDNAVSVDVGAVTNDANDWILLPSLASVPVGHTIRIACNAGSNFELRTPASSGEKINTVNSDGTAEYLCVDAEVVVITKVSATDGWAAYDIPALGGVGTATVPD